MEKKVTNEINISKLEDNLNKLKPDFRENDTKHTELNKRNIKQREEESKEKKQFLDEIEFLRNTYINQFIEESFRRTDINAKNFITTHAKDFKEKVRLIIKKADEEYKSYIQKLESIELKNKELKRNINIVENHKNILNTQLTDAEESISKINKKYQIFNDLKPYYDDLITEFNINPDTYNPKNKLLSKDIRQRRKEAGAFNDEIKKARELIRQIIEIKKKEDSENRKINENISNKLRDVEIKNRNIEDEYNEKISKIKQEINVSYEYKEENFLLRNSFISLFNLFYDKLYLERGLNMSPKGINLSPEDYTPKTYETDEIVKYIFLMLKNSTEESTGLLLREIVSYCNMMLRNLQKGEKKIYYEPLSTVRQIESLIIAIEVQNEDLKEKIEKNTKINETNEDIINKLQKEINRVDKMLEILHNKMRDYYKKGKKLKGDNNSSEDNNNKTFKIVKDLKKRDTTKIYDFGQIINKNRILEEKFLKIKAELDKKRGGMNSKEKLKTEYSHGFNNIVAHTNRLFFYRNLFVKQKEVNIHMKAYKRMKLKLKKLKKVEPNKNKYISLENVVYNNVNGHLNNLIGSLKTLGK